MKGGARVRMKGGPQVRMKGGAQVMKRSLGILMTVLLMGGAEELVAQRRGSPQLRGGQRAEMELRVQARFDNLVREELELSDDETRQLQEMVEDFRSRRLEFSRGELNTRARVGRLGAAGRGRELTEEEASEILAEMLELSGAEATLFREEQEAFLRILSAPQVVRYIVMREQLGDRIRALRGGGGARPWAPRWPGSGAAPARRLMSQA